MDKIKSNQMKRDLVIFFCIVLFSYSFQQTDIMGETPKNISRNDISNNTIIDSLSKYMGDIVSIALDFVPYISNIKCLSESILGIDLVTGKNLTDAERILSLIGSIPFAGFLGGGKNFQNGLSFLKASERAFHGGKMRNFIKFQKASSRAFAKPNICQKIAKAGTFVVISTKSISKILREYNKK